MSDNLDKPHENILIKASPYSVREELTEMVVNDLLGPAGGPDEELDVREDRVRERYLVGMLAPKATAVEAETMDEVGVASSDDAETGVTDVSSSVHDTFFPSSMGMSFIVDPAVGEILVNTEWGKYKRTLSETQQKKDGTPALIWKREHITGEAQTIKLKDGVFGPIAPNRTFPLICLQGKIRRSETGWLVTLFLVNRQEEPKTKKDEAWIFQPKMKVTDSSCSQSIFINRKKWDHDLNKLDSSSKLEFESLEMLYRHKLEFSVGHGVSVHAEVDPENDERSFSLETDFIPFAEVEQQTTPTEIDNPDIKDLKLDMKELSEMSVGDLVKNLKILEIAYKKWIETEKKKYENSSEKLSGHKNAFEMAIKSCERVCKRIHAGIELIEKDGQAFEAFRFANIAMWNQRIRTIYSRKVRKNESTENIDVPTSRSWRLFQIAFILLNIPALTILDHPERISEKDAVVDLLWFPTGGGKTEAYLGLTAYTLAIRRLQKNIGDLDGENGVAVLMRYTLRLLTLQQFQRAAALICACEMIRRGNETKWGKTPFRLGLWVGSKTTPNTLKSAALSLLNTKHDSGGAPYLSGTPHQIKSCPWCGCEIKPDDIKVYEPPNDIGRCVIYCGDQLGKCEFSARKSPKEGLPVMVVDEEIYRRPPSLLIATVDKFAQMPWKGETQMLFGKISGECPRHGFLSPEIECTGNHPGKNGSGGTKPVEHVNLRPPDLIIQDELHLISGPLGSMVGLYEAAIEELCSWKLNGKKIVPKVIASTATIRRAHDQIKKLFVKNVEIFPAQGTNIRDSFFARQREASEEFPGRRYMGICAFGRRYPVVLIRVYVAFMAAAQALYNKYDNLADPWMTLAGYFNSMRELAGTRRLVEDDIRARLRDADQRGLAKRLIKYGAVEELTSRKSGSDIPIILERLEITFDKSNEEKRKAEKGEKKKVTLPNPYDVVLATNMISVGVDIERLGLMVVSGQPKSTSEYIQATSRVGRSKGSPGLVCTVFNWARPRDLSHYESFEHYHNTFYKHVEALSVTPYSPRALDRGLSGVFAALIRLFDDKYNANEKAGKLSDTEPRLKEIFDVLIKRSVNATQDKKYGELIKNMLNKRRDYWLSRIHKAKDHAIGYKDDKQSVVGLLLSPEKKDWELFTCLNSLRDVEGEVNLIYDPNTRGLTVENNDDAMVSKTENIKNNEGESNE